MIKRLICRIAGHRYAINIIEDMHGILWWSKVQCDRCGNVEDDFGQEDIREHIK